MVNIITYLKSQKSLEAENIVLRETIDVIRADCAMYRKQIQELKESNTALRKTIRRRNKEIKKLKYVCKI